MLYNIIKRRALGGAQSHLGEGAVSPGGGRSLTWGRRVPEAAEKSPDVGRRYRCKYLRISLKISNFTSNSNTL